MKYLFEEKIRIINLIKGGTSIRSVCIEYGIEYHGLKMWLAQYDAEGEDGIRKSKTPCRYTTKEKEEIVREHLKNKLTLQQTCLLYDISRTSIITWLREYRSRHDSQEVNEQTDVTLETMARLKKKDEMTELEKLQYENLRLRAELDLLKKVKALVEERERRLKETGRKPSAD